MDERDAGIHWSIVVQEAARLVGSTEKFETDEEAGAAIVDIANKIWTWRAGLPEFIVTLEVPQATTPIRNLPREEPPVPDVPYDPDEALRHCIDCGSLLEHRAGQNREGKDYDGYFCPKSDKSDPNRHKPVWK